jgi:glycosyltransferase involved in cell wall biosynthesis
MNVLYENVDFSSSSGPNSFGLKLARSLGSLGCIPSDPSDYDVSLLFIKRPSYVHYNVNDSKKPIVQRLDGIWPTASINSSDNVRIRHWYDISERVIFQTEFDKKVIETAWGVRENTHVILNGTDCLDMSVPSALQSLRKQYDKLFVCSAHWHRQKRLVENVALFNHLSKTTSEKCGLIVCGPVQPQEQHLLRQYNIMHGVFSTIECKMIYSICDWMIHLSWLDHCPNVVVDAVSVGTPIICSDQGGTREIIIHKDSNTLFGVLIPESFDYQWDLIDTDDPPIINISNIDMDSLPKKESLCLAPNVNISKTAEMYKSVLNSAIQTQELNDAKS